MRQRRNRCFADLRPHKLQATLRSAYVRLSQSRGAKLALLEPHAIPRPAASGRSRPFRCSSSPNCKRFAGLQFGSVCLARKSGQKEALDADRIVPQATESPRRRTLRPAHENLSAKLYYSAACVEQRSHRKQLPRKSMAKHAAVEITGHLRMRRWCTVFAFCCKQYQNQQL